MTPLPRAGPVLVVGSAGLDIVGRPTDKLLAGASTPGILRTSLGGVGRNVAENLARLGAEVVLLSAIGADIEGARLLEETAAAGVNVDHCLPVEGEPTGAYLAVLDGAGNLQHALDDMRVMASITPEVLRQRRHLFQEASVVFIDTNLPTRTLAAAIGLARRSGVPVAADPTALSLAPRLVPHLQDLWLITPNQTEAEQLCPVASTLAGRERASDIARWLVSQGVDIAIVAMAEFGVVYATPDGSGHVPAIRTEVVEPTGAGDALTAAVIFGLINEIPVDEAVRLGVSAASLTLRTRGSVVPDLSLERLYEELR
jgi:pseudouridine kinase